MAMPEKVKKRDGRVVKFDQGKITEAIYKAAESVDGSDRDLAEALAGKVTEVLESLFTDKIPTIEDIQDTVEKVLIESGHSRTAKSFILYRKKRDEIRAKTKVRKVVKKKASTTDQQLLVDSDSDTEYQGWNKKRIEDTLVAESGIAPDEAAKIASVVEKRVIQSGVSRIGTSLIRELVNNELFERGYTKQLEKQTLIGMSNSAINDLLHSKGKENSNISSNNPEAINLSIAENTIKQYMLQDVFSPEVGDAHKNGLVHIHDLGYPRIYCSGHSLEYIKKYGLDLVMMDTKSAPAKHAHTLTGHLNTFISCMQAYYAGALGLGAVNVFYAPYLEDATDTEIAQEAQYMIFSGAQNCFSRGGQLIFEDMNLYFGVPDYLKEIPAIGPGGKYTGRNYGSYDKTAQRIAKAMLKVWNDGDANGHLLNFPKPNLHINDETFSNPEHKAVFDYACEVAAHNGSPYFAFDRDSASQSACCRLRFTIEDDYLLKHPEHQRFSFPRNELVTIKDGESVQCMSYGKLFDSRTEKSAFEDGFEIKYLKDVKVWDKNGWTNLIRVLRHRKTGEGSNDLVSIRTNSGKLVCSTANHPTLVKDTNKPKVCKECGGQNFAPWGNTKYGKQVVKCLSCSRYFSVDSFVAVGKEYMTNADSVNSDLSMVPCDDPIVERNKNIDKDLAYLLGVYLGDGCLNKNGFYITGLEDSFSMSNVKRIVKTRTGKDLKHNRYKYYFSFPELRAICGDPTTAYMKQLPDDFLSWDADTFGNVVSGIIDTDGCIHKSKITISSVSKAMLTQLQTYLRIIGVKSIMYLTNKSTGQTYYNQFKKAVCNCHPAFTLEFANDALSKKMFNMSGKVSSTDAYEATCKWEQNDIIRSVDVFVDRKEDFVYDITTETGTFVSNGILLHNCGFQNVTINLPQCAYRAGKGKIRKLYQEIDKAMEIGLKAHLQKKEFIDGLMHSPNLPLWQLGKPASDGKPYVELDKCTYIIGMIGLNECVQYLFGKELHEDDETLKAGLRIISHMFYTVKEFGEKYGLKFTLEESPAESASRRFARIDLKKFPESAEVIKGDIEKDETFYTNSIHLNASCNVDLVQRIIKQAKFHNLIESGAIIHAFVGENRPSAKSIAKLVEMTYRKTNAAQITISPEFTICKRCKKMIPGMSVRCQSCGAENINEAKRKSISPDGTWTKENIEKFQKGKE